MSKKTWRAGSSPAMTHQWQPLFAFEFKRNIEFGAIGLDLSLGVQLQIEFDNFCDAKIAKRFSGSLDRGCGRLFPGFVGGTDQFNDLVDALSHVSLRSVW